MTIVNMRMRRMRRNVLPKFIEICMETHAGAHYMYFAQYKY